MLELDAFRCVVRDAPLVALDLLVADADGRYVLGLRRNRPAAGFWFVPGGRVYKDESLDAAFMRIARTELGLELVRAAAEGLSPCEHFYPDSFADAQASTHYIVLPYRLKIDGLQAASLSGDAQHRQFAWMSPAELLVRADVHANTRRYFDADA